MRALAEVAPGVFVATSRAMATTSTVLAARGEALLIDPAWMPDELEGLADALAARSWRVIGGFATHAHHDHLLWHPRLGAAPRWASPATARVARETRGGLAAELGPGFPPEVVSLLGRVEAARGGIPRGSVPTGFEPELIVHDGHAPGHSALWLARQGVLLAGDMLSDIELPLPFEPDDLEAYLSALDALADAAARAEVVVPGHGSPGDDPLARVDADRRYLDDMITHGRSRDPRIANEGMAEVHERIRRLARGDG